MKLLIIPLTLLIQFSIMASDGSVKRGYCNYRLQTHNDPNSMNFSSFSSRITLEECVDRAKAIFNSEDSKSLELKFEIESEE